MPQDSKEEPGTRGRARQAGGPLYKSVDRDTWRHFSTSKAAKLLRGLDFEVTDAAQLKRIRGFGDSMISKVDE